MSSFILKHFHNSFGTPAVFLHTQIVNQTAFIISDEITIYSHKTNLFTSAYEERRYLMKLYVSKQKWQN